MELLVVGNRSRGKYAKRLASRASGRSLGYLPRGGIRSSRYVALPSVAVPLEYGIFAVFREKMVVETEVSKKWKWKQGRREYLGQGIEGIFETVSGNNGIGRLHIRRRSMAICRWMFGAVNTPETIGTPVRIVWVEHRHL